MTDNEIIKVLNYCANVKDYEDCRKCPIKNTCDNHSERLVVVVADLVNRQKADIESFKKAIKVLEIMNDQQKGEIERLKKPTSASAIQILAEQAVNSVDRTPQFISEIKAEAIKEFAKKIEDTTWYSINSKGELVIGANSESDVALYKADDILKIAEEMVGDKDESKI